MDGEEVGRATRLLLPPLLVGCAAQDLAARVRPGRVRGQLPARGRAHRALLRPHRRGRPPAGRRRALPDGAAAGRGGTSTSSSVASCPTSASTWPSPRACAWTARSRSPATGGALRAAAPRGGGAGRRRHRVSRQGRRRGAGSAAEGARALLFPGEEDFGIVPVEAQAAGVPVIAYGVGGAARVGDRRADGVLFDEQSAAGLAAAIERFEELRLDPDRDARERQRGSAGSASAGRWPRSSTARCASGTTAAIAFPLGPASALAASA